MPSEHRCPLISGLRCSDPCLRAKCENSSLRLRKCRPRFDQTMRSNATLGDPSPFLALREQLSLFQRMRRASRAITRLMALSQRIAAIVGFVGTTRRGISGACHACHRGISGACCACLWRWLQMPMATRLGTCDRAEISCVS